jgi:hypothetical protein
MVPVWAPELRGADEVCDEGASPPSVDDAAVVFEGGAVGS